MTLNNNGVTPSFGTSLAPPLRTRSDMPSTWKDVELSFDEAAERIVKSHEADGEHRDLPITDLRTWCLAPTRQGEFALVPLARHHDPKPLRANAFNNLMARLGAPAEFVRSLPAPLALSIANFLILERDPGTPATLRLRNDETSAVVSGRYCPLDAIELMETIRSSLARFGVLGDVRVRGVAAGMTDNLRIVIPSEQAAVKPGDVSAVGIDITTSSFARSSIAVVPVTWRLVCANGARRAERGSGLAFRHTGDRERLRQAVQEAVPTAITHARGFLNEWRKAVDFMIEDVQRQIESLRELTTAEKKNLETEVLRETGRLELPARVDLYSFINAMTSSAKAAAPARRLDIEALAGDVLVHHVGSA